jgi:hypothetical protein
LRILSSSRCSMRPRPPPKRLPIFCPLLNSKLRRLTPRESNIDQPPSEDPSCISALSRWFSLNGCTTPHCSSSSMSSITRLILPRKAPLLKESSTSSILPHMRSITLSTEVFMRLTRPHSCSWSCSRSWSLTRNCRTMMSLSTWKVVAI